MEQGICFLGDSITKGVIYNSEKSRYIIVKDSFANIVGQRCGTAVRNLSKFGNTVTDGLNRFEKNKEDLADCQTVIMDFGGNDCDFLWSEVSDKPDASHDPKTILPAFQQQYMQLISDIRACGKTPVLLNLPPVDHQRYFAWISRNLNADNILKWLGGSSDFIYRWHEQYNIAVHKIAQSANAKLIDIRSIFLERRDYRRFLCADGIHPNVEGHALIAEAVTAGTY